MRRATHSTLTRVVTPSLTRQRFLVDRFVNEDSATGKDVWLAAAMRCGLYLVVAGYGWLCILLLEQWRPVGRPLAEGKLADAP